MPIVKKLALYSAVLLLVVIGACAIAPVQEMSDARQALQAAESVNAPTKATLYYRKAKQNIEQAESALQQREYGTARQQAKQAKENALKAHEISVSRER